MLPPVNDERKMNEWETFQLYTRVIFKESDGTKNHPLRHFTICRMT